MRRKQLMKIVVLLLRCSTVVFGIKALKEAKVPNQGTSQTNPNFTSTIQNLTIARSRDATFRCSVNRLNGYRIGWVKADTKAIQAIHDHVITHNPRVSVSHSGYTTWYLHIKNVQDEDSGQYMCQLNTDPMMSQTGTLDIVVPPDFVFEETSGDVEVQEGGTVKLKCKASGQPQPQVQWRRENGEDIIIRDYHGGKAKMGIVAGEILRLSKVMRSDMGAYMCIATNGVPPTVSKRVMVTVNFTPAIHVPNQLVGAPLGTDVELQCVVESSPRSINYWLKDQEEMVISSHKYEVQVTQLAMFTSKMIVIIRNLQKPDVGTYRCIAKNSLGEVEGNVRLYEIPGSSIKYSSYDEEDYGDQTGSADKEYEGHRSNSVADRGKSESNRTGAARKGNRNKKAPEASTTSSAMRLQIIFMSPAVLLYVALAI